MRHPRLARPVDRYAGALVAMAIALFPVQPAGAIERIGNAIQIVRTVTGEVQADFRYLILADPVFQNEVIETRPGSASRIVFRDRSELQVGPGARVTLDSFVFDTDPSLARFFVSAFDGVLRFATGKLAKSAYRIETPTAIIGVRGTTFASIFGPAGEQVILLEEGVAVTVQDRNGGPLRTLTQPGLSLTVSSDGSISDPQPPPQWAVDKLRELTALLFTLDEIQRGDQFDDDEKPPVEPPPPVQQGVEVQPATPPREPKAAPEYRPDIRIERSSRTTYVHGERDEAGRHTSKQLAAQPPAPSANRRDTRQRPEQREAHDNRQNRPSSDRQRQQESEVSAVDDRPQHVSAAVSESSFDQTGNRSEGNERGERGHGSGGDRQNNDSRSDGSNNRDWGGGNHGERGRGNEGHRR